MNEFENPFRPGAGHPPPYLAGRQVEREQFQRLLAQRIVVENMVLSGLRGVGKTVLLDALKPLAVRQHWLWVGADMSESTSISEAAIATRLCADLAVLTAALPVDHKAIPGFSTATEEIKLDYTALCKIHECTPGLALDKLKEVIKIAWLTLTRARQEVRGVVFAYDEAQNLSNDAHRQQYPLSLLLDAFQSVQRQGIPAMLVLAGLPTLYPRLVNARTFAERMFRVVFLDTLNPDESKQAILLPLAGCPVVLSTETVDGIVQMSGGYPYFIQFICREVYDVFTQQAATDTSFAVPVQEIERKLDTDFFAGRWARTTDRQRELLMVIAKLKNCDTEFTVQEVVAQARQQLSKPFSNSHVNQMFNTMSERGLLFRNRHGRYALAVPLFGRFIRRQATT